MRGPHLMTFQGPSIAEILHSIADRLGSETQPSVIESMVHAADQIIDAVIRTRHPEEGGLSVVPVMKAMYDLRDKWKSGQISDPDTKEKDQEGESPCGAAYWKQRYESLQGTIILNAETIHNLRLRIRQFEVDQVCIKDVADKVADLTWAKATKAENEACAQIAEAEIKSVMASYIPKTGTRDEQAARNALERVLHNIRSRQSLTSEAATPQPDRLKGDLNDNEPKFPIPQRD